MEQDKQEMDGVEHMKTLYDSQAFDFVGDYEAFNEARSRAYNIPGFKETTKFTPKYSAGDIKAKEKKSKRLISKFFSNMSRIGVSYDQQVIQNMRAIPADKTLIPKDSRWQSADMFNSIQSSWKNKDNRDKSFFEKDIAQKREMLRALALQPELEEILDTMANEAIVYDSNYVYFLEPYIDDNDMIDFKQAVRKKINNSVNKAFRKCYRYLEWRTRAWDDFKRWLIEGELAWEIVYDDLKNPKEIIGLIPLDPATLTRTFENDKWYYVQYKDVVDKERPLLDAQVIWIQFQETNAINRLSYLERLIRPYNIYRIIEQAQLIWVVTNSSYKMKYTIPVKNMNRALGSQTLNSAMNRYKEDIKFISDSGELQINGQPNLPFNRDFFMPESDNGTPDIETIGGDGPELMDSDYLKYFYQRLIKVSKIPLNRFDQESGDTWMGTDAESYARTEIDFARYVTRLRNTFAQIILKPVRIQLCLDMKELQEDKEFLNCIQMHYKSYNLFEELMEIELMTKRVEHITNLKDSMVDMDIEGNEIKYFASKFLIQKYLKFSDQDIELNKKYKQEEIEELHLAGGETSDAGAGVAPMF